MKSSPTWLSTKGVAPEMIRARNILVKDKTGREIQATLEVEQVNKQMDVIVSANYNSSPFSNSVSFAKFYLTQEQFDEFVDKGAKCILQVPQ
jgi:hypothetical protein